MQNSMREPVGRMIRQQIGLLAGDEWLLLRDNGPRWKVVVNLDKGSKQPVRSNENSSDPNRSNDIPIGDCDTSDNLASAAAMSIASLTATIGNVAN